MNVTGKPNTFYGKVMKWCAWLLLIVGGITGYAVGNVPDPNTLQVVQNWTVTASIWFGVGISALMLGAVSHIIRIIYSIHMEQERYNAE